MMRTKRGFWAMSSSRPWIPLYVDDYLGDPVLLLLPLEDHGPYLLLLFHMWKNDGKIHFDSKSVAKMLRISAKKASNLMQKLQHLFTIYTENGEVFATQKRLNIELEKSKEISGKRRRAVNSRNDRQGAESGTNVDTKGVTNGSTSVNTFVSDLYPYSHSHSHNNIKALESSSLTTDFEALENEPLSEGEVAGVTLPSEQADPEPKTQRQRRKEFDFQVSFEQFADLWNRHMPKYGLTQIVSITRDRERAFKDRVLEDPAQRNDIGWWGGVLRFASESDFLMGKSPPQEGRTPWKMGADWLIGCGKEKIDGQWCTRGGTMLAKLLEGEYHEAQPGRWCRGEYQRTTQSTLPVTGTG